MSELTKEYFDKHVLQLEQRFDDVEMRIDSLNTKMENEFNGLATMIAKGFEDIAKRLDIRDRVDTLENKMTKVESALNVRL